MRFLSLFFNDYPSWGFIYFRSGSKRRACERKKKTENGERERKRERGGGRERERERREDEHVGRITMQLFSFQLVN